MNILIRAIKTSLSIRTSLSINILIILIRAIRTSLSINILIRAIRTSLRLQPYAFKPDLNHQTNKSTFDEKKLNGGDGLIDNVTFERVRDEKFPPGWVKEIRVRKTGDKQEDQFYIDPASGYKFRSKLLPSRRTAVEPMDH
ncbi:hypothetical protein POM88_030271 [Heracleum sosnowskyi]|uniref:MBD domain-containing protein n=1 Tax=Heracleum sosnowskyi TaxID=360622 RepID=A0AAD8HW54_9APIA|nr:hypothetical protein POM88_030271 [Heracleum sosnowskyi]